MTTAASSATAKDSKTAAPEQQYGRPHAIEERSNRYLIHPLSDVVVKISHKLGISPNALSLTGLALGLFAAWLYYQMNIEGAAIGAFAAMFGWHVLDGADGRLARLTGQASAFGRIIDGICDHIVYTAVYFGMVFYLIADGWPLTVWWLAVAAGVSHIVQAAGYEERRQKYQRRSRGQVRDDIQKKLLEIDGKKSFFADLYDKAQRLVAGGDYGLDARLSKLAENPERHGEVSRLVEKSAKMVRAWSLLNANNRTLMIFVFCVLGVPHYYFIYELTVLNVVLIALMIAERSFEKRLVQESEAADQAAA